MWVLIPRGVVYETKLCTGSTRNKKLVCPPGFEPGLIAYRATVLPLDERHMEPMPAIETGSDAYHAPALPLSYIGILEPAGTLEIPNLRITGAALCHLSYTGWSYGSDLNGRERFTRAPS